MRAFFCNQHSSQCKVSRTPIYPFRTYTSLRRGGDYTEKYLLYYEHMSNHEGLILHKHFSRELLQSGKHYPLLA